MSWDAFTGFAAAAALCWILGSVAAFVSKKKWPAAALSLLGTAVLLFFIVGMWVTLKRPPMRTMGETRLWYSLFLSLIGAVIYLSWRYKWILPFSTLMALVFLCVNLFKPVIHDRPLMPALQSPWFVPHVIVYMFAYALLGAATLYAVWLWIRMGRSKSGKSLERPSGTPPEPEEMRRLDILVRIGWAFLTFGMVMGALWAKEAWGDWWGWDPKETWALATWLGYLGYLHLRKRPPFKGDVRVAFAVLILCFLLLQMCWWGVNYLPSARGISVHTY